MRRLLFASIDGHRCAIRAGQVRWGRQAGLAGGGGSRRGGGTAGAGFWRGLRPMVGGGGRSASSGAEAEAAAVHVALPLLAEPANAAEYTALAAALAAAGVPLEGHRRRYDAAGLPLSDRQIAHLAEHRRLAPDPAESFAAAVAPALLAHAARRGEADPQQRKIVVLHPKSDAAEKVLETCSRSVPPAELYRQLADAYGITFVADPVFDKAKPRRLGFWQLRPPAIGIPHGDILMLTYDTKFTTVSASFLKKIDDFGHCVSLDQIQYYTNKASRSEEGYKGSRTLPFLTWLAQAEEFRKLPAAARAASAMGRHQDAILECVSGFEPLAAIRAACDGMESAPRGNHRVVLYLKCLQRRLEHAMRGLPYRIGPVTVEELEGERTRDEFPLRMPYLFNISTEHRAVWDRYKGNLYRLLGAFDRHGIPGSRAQLRRDTPPAGGFGVLRTWWTKARAMDRYLGPKHDEIAEQIRLFEPWYEGVLQKTLVPAQRMRVLSVLYSQVSAIMAGIGRPEPFTEEVVRVVKARNVTKFAAAKKQPRRATARYSRVPFIGPPTEEYLAIVRLPVPALEKLRLADEQCVPMSHAQAALGRADKWPPASRMRLFINEVVDNLLNLEPQHRVRTFGPKEEQIRALFVSIGLTEPLPPSDHNLSRFLDFFKALSAAIMALTRGDALPEADEAHLRAELARQRAKGKSSVPLDRPPYLGSIPDKLCGVLAGLGSFQNCSAVLDMHGIPGSERQVKVLLALVRASGSVDGVAQSDRQYGHRAFQKWLQTAALQRYTGTAFARGPEVARAVKNMKLPADVVMSPSLATVFEAYKHVCDVLAGADPGGVRILQKSSRIQPPASFAAVALGDREYLRLPAAGQIDPQHRLLLMNSSRRMYEVAEILEERGLPGCLLQIRMFKRSDVKKFNGKDLFTSWVDRVRAELHVAADQRTMFAGKRDSELIRAVRLLNIQVPAAQLTKPQLSSVYAVLCRVQSGEDVPESEMVVSEGDGGAVLPDLDTDYTGRVVAGQQPPHTFMPWVGPYTEEVVGIVRTAARLQTRSAFGLTKQQAGTLYDILQAQGAALSFQQMEQLLDHARTGADVPPTNVVSWKAFALWLLRMLTLQPASSTRASLQSRATVAYVFGLRIRRSDVLRNPEAVARLAFGRLLSAARAQAPQPIAAEELAQALASPVKERKLHRMPYVGAEPLPVADVRKIYGVLQYERQWMEDVEVPGIPCSSEQLKRDEDEVVLEPLETFKAWIRDAVKLLHDEDAPLTLGLHEDTILSALRASEASSRANAFGRAPDAYFVQLYDLILECIRRRSVDKPKARELVAMLHDAAQGAKPDRTGMALTRVLRNMTQEPDSGILDEANAKLTTIARVAHPTPAAAAAAAEDQDTPAPASDSDHLELERRIKVNLVRLLRSSVEAHM